MTDTGEATAQVSVSGTATEELNTSQQSTYSSHVVNLSQTTDYDESLNSYFSREQSGVPSETSELLPGETTWGSTSHGTKTVTTDGSIDVSETEVYPEGGSWTFTLSATFDGDLSDTYDYVSEWTQTNGGAPVGASQNTFSGSNTWSGTHDENGTSTSDGDSNTWSGTNGGGGESHLIGMPGYDPLELEGQIGGLHFSLGGPGVQEPGTPENISFAIPTSLGTDSGGGDEDPPAEEEETWLHFATGFIPVYGSARDAYESFRDGNYIMGAVNVGFLTVDLLTFGAGGTGAKAILKGGVVGVKALAKAGLKETIETAAIKGFQAAKGGLDNIGGKLFGGGATNAGKVAGDIRKVIPESEVAEEGGLTLFKWNHATSTRASGWRSGDRFLHLPNQGSAKANWIQNASRLRAEMRKGAPIFDSYVNEFGNLISTRGFLNMERNLLIDRGWTFNIQISAWLPPL